MRTAVLKGPFLSAAVPCLATAAEASISITIDESGAGGTGPTVNVGGGASFLYSVEHPVPTDPEVSYLHVTIFQAASQVIAPTPVSLFLTEPGDPSFASDYLYFSGPVAIDSRAQSIKFDFVVVSDNEVSVGFPGETFTQVESPTGNTVQGFACTIDAFGTLIPVDVTLFSDVGPEPTPGPASIIQWGLFGSLGAAASIWRTRRQRGPAG